MVNDDQKTTASPYGPRTVRSVRHAVGLLRVISAATAAPTLSALARKLELSKPATYNLLNTLIAEGLVRRNDAGRYEVSWGMYEMGSGVSREVTAASRMPLDRLAASTGGAALLSVLERETVLYLDRGQEDPSFAMVANVGRRSPLHTNASGKVLLAGLDDRSLRRYLARPLVARTSTTITDPSRLLGELRRVRDEGYGACWGEQEPELSSVAVAIVDSTGRTRASLAVAVHTKRFATMSRSGLLARMHDEAKALAQEIDWAALFPESQALQD